MDTPSPPAEPLRRPARRLHPLAIGSIGAVVALLAAVAAAVVVDAVAGGDRTPSPDPEVDIALRPEDREAPPALIGGDPVGSVLPDTPLNRLDGGTTSFADYRGRPVVVNFFGSWCAPCKQELPAFAEVSGELGDQVAFVGVSVQDPVGATRELLDEFDITYDVVRDPNFDFTTELEIVNLPATFFVGSDGRVSQTHLGVITEDELREGVSQLS